MVKIILKKLKPSHIEDILNSMLNSNVFLVSRIFTEILIAKIEVQD